MAKRSGARETNVELSCMWGLFSILQSGRCLESPKFISHGWPVSRHEIADHPRKFEKQQPTSFDGECRKIRDEVESRRVSFNGSVGSISRQSLDKEQQHGKTDSVRVHDLAKAHERARRHGEDVMNQPSSFSSLTDLASSSSTESWNELAVRLQMSGKALIDQKLIDRDISWKQHGGKSEPKSFSSSLEVLSMSKTRFVDLLPEPDSLLSRRFKNGKPSRTEKERIKTMLDDKLSEYMSKEASPSQKAKNSNKHSRQKIDYHCSCSPKKSSVFQPNDIVVLKPGQQNVKNFEYLSCNPTYFTLRETRKKLNRAFGSARKESNQCSMNGASDALARSKRVGDDGAGCVVETKKFSNSVRGSGSLKNQDIDVAMEAKRHLCERLRKRNNVVNVRNGQPARTLSRILASPEHDERKSSLRLNHAKDDDERKSSVMISPNEDDHEMDTSNGQSAMVLESELHGDKSLKNNDNVEHSMLDSASENEASTSPADDFQSPSSACQLDVAESIKSQEHQSPVSVLEPYFIEEADSPQNTTLHKGRRKLQPRQLDFKEPAIESLQEPLFDYVRLIMQASQLDWDQLAMTRSLLGELLPASLFNEMEFLPTECSFEPKLLFDHINEVLIQIHRSHFCSQSPLSPGKPKSGSLAELVVHEITRQADFYLLPYTDRRTLDQLVSGNTECCRSWLDLQPDSEQIMADIADGLLEECILHILYESLA